MAAGALTSSLALTLRPPLRFPAPPIWIPAAALWARGRLRRLNVCLRVGSFTSAVVGAPPRCTGRIPAPAARVGNISPRALIGDQ